MARIERLLQVLAPVLVLSAVARADFPAPQLDIVNPRPFGYVIGDVLERQITVQLPGSYELDRTSLSAGPRDDGFEARPARVERSTGLDRTRYRISLAYQILQSPDSAATWALPEVTLIFRRGSQQLAQTVPDWPVTVAPLTPPIVLARAGLSELRPDRVPGFIAVRPLELRLTAYTGLFALVLAYLGYRRFGWFHFHGAGPFARAYRDLKAITARDGDGPERQGAMRRLHRAFNETAGRTVFAGQLDEFFSSHPRFMGLRQSIESFFGFSRQEFFGGSGASRMAFADLFALCRACYRRERERP